MKFILLSVLTTCACFLTFGLQAQNTIKDEATGTVFPKEVTIEHDGKTYQLEATGISLRKKFFVKVYSIASYLQKGVQVPAGDKFQAILNGDNAKQLIMHWVHQGPIEKVKGGFREGFDSVFNNAEQAKLKGDIDKFIGFFTHDAQKGDEYVLRWLPGGYVEVSIDGKVVGSLTNPEFAKGLWNIWFGPNSVVNRDNLVANLK